MGGDGLTGAVAGELRGTATACSASSPAGAGTTSRASSAIPPTRSAAVRRAGDRRASGASTSRRPAAARTSDPRAPASTPTSTRSPTRRGSSSATLVYIYGVLRAMRGWQPAGWEVVGRRRARTRSPGTRSRSRTPASSAAGCSWCPTRWSTTACSTSSLIARPVQARLPARPAAGVQGHALPATRRLTLVQGREVTFSADRPFTAYADGDPIAELPDDGARAPGALRVVAPR